MCGEDPCPGLALAAENHVLATCGDHYNACFTQSRASVNTAHSRLFRFILPARIHVCGFTFHCADLFEGHYRHALQFGSDESQHLHVVWGWARGFVQYRDLADNHMPLFQILCAPIYKLIGDRGTILYWMRIILQPLYILAFWCTYRIGSLLFSRRVGVWAAILVGLSFDYAFCSVEFRTDNLWAPLWLLCLSVLLGGALTMRRALIAGFLMGLCFGVSMKTLLLLMSIVIGGSMTLVFVGRERLGIGWGQILGALAAFFASALIVPATIMAAFALYGIWPQFRYWVFDHNVVPGLSNHPAWWVIIFAVGFPLVALGARRIVAATPEADGGGAPEFCLCHGRLLLYRARFLLALSVAAGLPPFLSARLCHLYGRSSDDFGPLGTESEYREDLACHAHARLVRCMRIIGGLVGSPFLGRQGETGERSFAGHAQTY